jgi:hypothetical protein
LPNRKTSTIVKSANRKSTRKRFGFSSKLGEKGTGRKARGEGEGGRGSKPRGERHEEKEKEEGGASLGEKGTRRRRKGEQDREATTQTSTRRRRSGTTWGVCLHNYCSCQELRQDTAFMCRNDMARQREPESTQPSHRELRKNCLRICLRADFKCHLEPMP